MNLLKLFDRVIDEGSLKELLEKNKNFKTMWDDFVAQS